MKLAEALIQRTDCKKRMEQLKERMSNNARVQEGEQPAEDALILLRQYDRIATEFEDLVRKINRTNLAARIDAEQSLTDALAKRDVLRLRYRTYSELADAATVILDRYSRSEIPLRSAVDVTELRDQAHQIAAQCRVLEGAIQKLNWEVDLQD